MADDLNPTAPSQPPLDTAYHTSSNPSSKSAQDRIDTSINESKTSGTMQDSRRQGDVPVPSTHKGKGNASALGYGGDGSGDRDVGPPGEPNTEADQMRMPGEGEVASAQDRKHGFGQEGDLASDLDRKKEEQKDIKEGRGKREGDMPGKGGHVDVQGVLGGMGKTVVGAAGDSGAGGEDRGDGRVVV